MKLKGTTDVNGVFVSIPSLEGRLNNRRILEGGGVDIEYSPDPSFEHACLELGKAYTDPDEWIEFQAKAIPQTGAVSGWALAGIGKGGDWEWDDRAIADVKREFTAAVLRIPKSELFNANFPVDAAVGAPFFQAGESAVAAYLEFLRSEVLPLLPNEEAAILTLRAVNAHIGLVGWRFGSVIKDVPLRDRADAFPTTVKAIRTRQVYGVSFLLNWLLTPLAHILTHGKGIYAEGTFEEVTLWVKGLLAGDWSRFDMRVSLQAMDVVNDIIIDVWGAWCQANDTPFYPKLLLYCLQGGRDFITAPCVYDADPALISGADGLRSGLKVTAIVGALINAITHRTIQLKSGLKFKGKYFGDDTLLLFEGINSVLAPPSIYDVYSAVVKEMDVAIGVDMPTWLQQRFNGLVWRPKYLRRLVSMLYPESPRDGDLRLLSIAAKALDVPRELREAWVYAGLLNRLRVSEEVIMHPMEFIRYLSPRIDTTGIDSSVEVALERYGLSAARSRLRFTESFSWLAAYKEKISLRKGKRGELPKLTGFTMIRRQQFKLQGVT